MAMESKKVERIVGIFVLLLVGITVSLLVVLLRQQDWFVKKFDLHVVFAKGVSIAEGTPVSIEGIQVGRVKHLGFDIKNQLEGVLAISERYRWQIRKDSVATVVRSHFLATPQIDISVGSPEEPLLQSGDTIPGIATLEPSMKDFMALANNVVTLARDLRDPTGSFQRILRNLEEVSTRMAQGSGTVPTMLKDDGKLYQQSTELLSGFHGIIQDKTSVPITLTQESILTLSPQSQLVVNLSDKLDKQTDIFAQVAKKMSVIEDRLMAKDNMAGALISDSEFYSEMREFFKEGRRLMLNLQALSEDLRTVVPKLPTLIEEGSADLKEMGKVLRGLQRLPFVGGGQEALPKPQALQAQGRLGSTEDRR